MLYTFGDSVTYGFNFLDEKERKMSIWPNFLSKKLNCEYTDLSAPGASNWRNARLINNINFTQNDIVIFALTSPERFEFGVNKNHKPPKNDPKRIGDILEFDGEIITKRFYPQIIERSTDLTAKQFATIAYTNFYNISWFEEFLSILLNSCIYKMTQNNCKWIFFNTWADIKLNNNYPKNFIYSEFNMVDIMNKSFGLKKDYVDYWDINDHKLVAEIIYKKYKEIYE